MGADETQREIGDEAEGALTTDQIIAIVKTRFAIGEANWMRAAEHLVAEVLRLREESAKRLECFESQLELYHQAEAAGDAADAEVSRLRELIGRVETLPVKWRQDYEDSGRDGELASCESCADELEAALRGES